MVIDSPEIGQSNQASDFLCVHLDCNLSETEFAELENNLKEQFSNNWGFDNFCHSKNYEEKICLIISSNVRFKSSFYKVLTNAIRTDPSEAFYFDYEIEKDDQAQLLPEWSPLRFIGKDYIGPVIAIRESESFSRKKIDREFLSELFISGEVIPRLIKQISYTDTGSTQLISAQKRVNFIKKNKIYDDLTFSSNDSSNSVEIHFQKLSPEKISVVIPTRGKRSKNSKKTYLESCLESIFRQKVNSSIVEIIIVYDTEVSFEYLNFLPKSPSNNFSIEFVPFEKKFNFSEKCNLGAKVSSGKSLVFLNDDVEFISLNSLSELSGASMFNNHGAVGTKLIYPNGKIQHGGIIKTDQGFGHAYIGSENNSGKFGDLTVCHEVTAVTGACLCISQSNFKKIGGWDEKLSNSYNDVALCLAAKAAGFENIILNSIEVRHIESATRLSITLPADQIQISKYTQYIEPDEKFLRISAHQKDNKNVDLLKRISTVFARVLYLLRSRNFKIIISLVMKKLRSVIHIENDRIEW